MNPTGDPAIGRPAPQVHGFDFDGTPVAITADGRPKVAIFLAHWCPHCQAEVPLIQSWIEAGGVPDGVDLVSIATGIDSAAPNYPPDAWLEREGWTVPVIADPTNSVATRLWADPLPGTGCSSARTGRCERGRPVRCRSPISRLPFAA